MRDRAWISVGVVGALVVCGFLLLGGDLGRDALLAVTGGGAVTCVLVGVAFHRPTVRVGWYLLATGCACLTTGQWLINFSYLARGISLPVSLPGVADVFSLAAYPLLAAGASLVARDPHNPLRRDDYTDAAIISIGALAVAWQLLLHGYVHRSGYGTEERLVLIAHPVLDVVVLFVVARSLLFAPVRRPVHNLLAAGLLVWIAADLTGAYLASAGNDTSVAAGALFLLAYVLLGTAALHPSVGRDGDESPDLDRREAGNRRRMPFVALAGFIPPAMLVVTSYLGVVVAVPVMATLCMMVAALVYLRMIWLIERMRAQSLEIQGHAHALEKSHLQRDALESELRHLAFHDDLTGLANRALLRDRVEHALSAVARTGRSVALCFGDLDGFKTVNDTLGHHVGDAVLMKAAAMLNSIVRPGDTVARLGGDEFAVLMVDVEDPQSAVDFARRVVAVLHEAVEFEGMKSEISISVGVAFADSTKTTEQLISEADVAMYEAKANGKHRVEVFQSSMRSRLLERLELTNGFRGSLERSEFFLQYQPIFSLADGRLQGFEVLTRWAHPTMGQVGPVRFIPVAEETGFIVPLGRWVLVEACEQLAAWSATMHQPLSLAVNVSRRQLVSTDLASDVRTAIALSGIAPEQLVLEITESVLMDDPEQARSALTELRAIGIRMAVDDFGTGYSSLSHLQRFPVDILKIDKSFIEPLNQSEPGSSALVTTILGLARNLDLTVVAEGIEREDQLQRLIELGCHNGQGYLMARPLDRRGASTLIDSYHAARPSGPAPVPEVAAAAAAGA